MERIIRISKGLFFMLLALFFCLKLQFFQKKHMPQQTIWTVQDHNRQMPCRETAGQMGQM